MSRTRLGVVVAMVLGAGATGGAAACSSTSASSSGVSPGGDASTGDGAIAIGTFKPELACTDSIASVYADPGDVSGKPKGAILKCAHDTDMTAAQLLAAGLGTTDDAGSLAYTGRPFTSGAHVYRVLYRTERGDPANSPGYSSALVLLPDTPREGVGKALPVVVAAHGSRGQAGKCAPSLNDPAASDVEDDFLHQVYPLVGFGFPVIAPDLAGYANFGGAGNPPPVYDSAADVGKSMLDGARALRQLIPSSLTPQVVITGHSQGGYTALATLAMSDSYGADGVIAGVAVYSPLWLSQGAWGALLVGDVLSPQDYAFSNSAAGPVSIWYHYTHSFLLDGPDAALELFDPTKAALVQSFVNNDCWQESYPDLLDAGTIPSDKDAGPTANDVFSAHYASAIGGPASGLGNFDCSGSSDQALCQTWIDRFKADYPHLGGGATKVPILIWYANGDDTIPPPDMQCVLDRLGGDHANLQVCYDSNPVGHSGVVSENADYVSDWIASRTLSDAGAPGPGHCTALAATDAGGVQLQGDSGPIACDPLLSTQ